MAARGILNRFNSLYIINKSTECWEATGFLNKGGYKKMIVQGKTMLAHRVSFLLFNGSIPNGMQVCHKCDNPKCLNPKHLFLGSAMDNMQDKINKGRHRGAKSGDMHHSSRLTAWQVSEIRKKLNNKTNQYEIAKEYGVSQSIISNIKTGKRWKA